MEQHDQDLINSLVKEYAKIESLAASILQDKQQMVDLDYRRNKTREALRQIKASHRTNADQDTIDAEITKLKDGLKPKVSQLHKMEGAAEVKGFELKGMKVEEMLNITSPDT